MTNEQLAILIRAWAERLGREIGVLDDELAVVGAEKFPRHKTLHYIGEKPRSIFGIFPVIDQPLDPDNWEWREDGDFEALDGLNDLAAELWDAVEKLEGEHG